MRIFEAVVLVGCALLLAGASQVQRDQAKPPAPAGTAAIGGRLLIDVGGSPQPVRRARVTLESETLPKPQTTDTDVDGRYRFEQLPAGRYVVSAEKAGFVRSVRDPRRTFERPAAVEITSSETAQHDLWMVRGAALEGQIRLDTGGPAVNVIVAAVRLAYDPAGRRPIAVRQARTDDRGRFRVHTLPAGEYYVDAAQDPVDAVRQASTPGRPTTFIARTFYPAAPRIENGQTISLATGQEVTSLDLTLSTVSTATLRGRIVDSTGTAATVAVPRIQRVGGPVGEVRGISVPDRSDFSFPTVPPGDYWLMGVARPSSTADLEFAAVRITVGGQDIDNFVLTTAKGAIVNGRVDVEGSAPTVPMQVIAHETEFEMPMLLDTSAVGVSSAAVAPDGTFFFNGIFGPRLLRLSGLPQGWALKSTSLDGVDVTDTPVDFRRTSVPRTLRIVITSRTSSVSGIVHDAGGKAMAGARVVVFGGDQRAWGYRSRVIKTGESGGDGRYSIDGLLDGTYHVVAVPFLEENSWLDASVLRRLQPMASTLAVTQAAQLTLNLVIKQ